MVNIKRLLHLILAFILIFLGIAGLVLPIINGTILLLLGLILISFQNPKLEYSIQKFVKKNSFLEKIYRKLDSWMRNVFN